MSNVLESAKSTTVTTVDQALQSLHDEASRVMEARSRELSSVQMKSVTETATESLSGQASSIVQAMHTGAIESLDRLINQLESLKKTLILKEQAAIQEINEFKSMIDGAVQAGDIIEKHVDTLSAPLLNRKNK